jgi:MoaA/NifB/PqqE/SkfB family radical SAM enzyme
MGTPGPPGEAASDALRIVLILLTASLGTAAKTIAPNSKLGYTGKNWYQSEEATSMRTSELTSMAVRGVWNHVVQQGPPQVVAALSHPTTVSIMITRRCNLRCVMCGIPELIWPHLSVEQWKAVLDDLADWAAGYCKLQFAGGEPMVFEGIYEILEHAVRRRLMPGMTTNGVLVSEKNAARLMDIQLSNVNVSLDGVGEVQNAVRGKNEANKPFDVWSKTDRGIRNLVAARRDRQSHTALFLKCCLMTVNAGDVANLVAYTRESGVDGITFQPVEIRDVDGAATDALLNDAEKLVAATEVLIRLKEQGGPITNTLEHLRLFKAYFRQPNAPEGYPGRQTCRIGNNSLEIHSDGRVQFCHWIGILGNVTEQPLSEIWKSRVANQHRGAIGKCSMGCLQTCYATKTLRQKASLFMKIAK